MDINRLIQQQLMGGNRYLDERRQVIKQDKATGMYNDRPRSGKNIQRANDDISRGVKKEYKAAGKSIKQSDPHAGKMYRDITAKRKQAYATPSVAPGAPTAEDAILEQMGFTQPMDPDAEIDAQALAAMDPNDAFKQLEGRIWPKKFASKINKGDDEQKLQLWSAILDGDDPIATYKSIYENAAPVEDDE